MNSIKDNLVTYIKLVFVELACNNSIDHRNYNSSKYQMPLIKTVIMTNNGNFDLSISEVADKLIQHNNFKLENLINNINSIDSDDYDDEPNELFYFVNDFIGFYEISSLHGDSQDKFKNKLLFLLGIINYDSESESESEPEQNYMAEPKSVFKQSKTSNYDEYLENDTESESEPE